MEDVFGSDSEDERREAMETPHDILDIDEDDDGGDRLKTTRPDSGKDEEKDLFGSDEEAELESSQVEKKTTPIDATDAIDAFSLQRKSHELMKKDDLFGSEDDEEEVAGNSTNFLNESNQAPTPPSFSKLCLPNIERLAEESQMLLKMPGFVKFQPKPFNPSGYDAEVESRLFNHAPAIIRWRYKRGTNGAIVKDAHGAPIRESNSRLVKWSDGTYQIVIGDETFDGQLVPVNDRSVA
jgi:RNA polymerase-associated protein LEO1